MKKLKNNLPEIKLTEIWDIMIKKTPLKKVNNFVFLFSLKEIMESDL